MSGRRGHQRYAVVNPAGGAIRVLRDVVIDRMDRDELLAFSQTAGTIGEELTLDLFSGRGCIALKVKVLDTRPVIVEGAVRHRLRLMVTTDALADLTEADALETPGTVSSERA